MKPKCLLLIFLVVSLNISTAFASGPDNEALPVYQMLTPNVDVLYFNQTLNFALPPLSLDVIDHVDFKNGRIAITPTGFTLYINYSNAPIALDELKVYTRGTAGDIKLAYQKNVVLKQKLSEKNFESVANDNNIFKLDDEIQRIDNTVAAQKLLHSHQLDVNADRFNQDSISLQSFDMEIRTTNGVKLFHSQANQITDEMRAAIKGLNDGDTITLLNIMAEYTANNQRIKMNLNYQVNYTIGTAG